MSYTTFTASLLTLIDHNPNVSCSYFILFGIVYIYSKPTAIIMTRTALHMVICAYMTIKFLNLSIIN